ncbi:putative A1 cistron-splicing factor AAR2 [Blattamonas nauphoetae]|uniref:A1 cistron-splicing factor AAR2 n=1 Tax=Blattamonas nauphoetae TaxID=2049346 RepID=A0ABQ9X7X5_9EUKA|nr:putative A1 cistron-splicing factor AAR2 [Blattamonas nauphoetae]
MPALLVLFPSNLNFSLGINLYSWTVGSTFRGITFLPTGPNYITYRVLLHGTKQRIENHYNVTLSFWVNLDDEQVLILRWNESVEQFDILSFTDEQEYQRILQIYHSGEYSKGMTPFQKIVNRSPSTNTLWTNLTNCIIPVHITQLMPDTGLIDPTTERLDLQSISKEELSKMTDQEKEAYHRLHGQYFSQSAETSDDQPLELDPDMFLTSPTAFSQWKRRADKVGETLSKSSLTSFALEMRLEREIQEMGGTLDYVVPTQKMERDAPVEHHYADHYHPLRFTHISAGPPTPLFQSKVVEKFGEADWFGALLGEMQLSFVCFLLGESWLSTVQWKRLLNALCEWWCESSETSALRAEKGLSLLTTIRAQLELWGGDDLRAPGDRQIEEEMLLESDDQSRMLSRLSGESPETGRARDLNGLDGSIVQSSLSALLRAIHTTVASHPPSQLPPVWHQLNSAALEVEQWTKENLNPTFLDLDTESSKTAKYINPITNRFDEVGDAKTDFNFAVDDGMDQMIDSDDEQDQPEVMTEEELARLGMSFDEL